MRCVLVFILTPLLSSNAVGQEHIHQVKTQVHVTRRGVPVVLNPLWISDVQLIVEVDSPMPERQLISELVTAVYSMESLADDSEKASSYARQHFRPLVAKLKQQADKQIPYQATHSQRIKLQAAASLDVKHAVLSLREGFKDTESFPTLPEQFRKMKSIEDLFGAGSLFEKVMRQQGLIDN